MGSKITHLVDEDKNLLVRKEGHQAANVFSRQDRRRKNVDVPKFHTVRVITHRLFRVEDHSSHSFVQKNSAVN
jgi:hypothetical protein